MKPPILFNRVGSTVETTHSVIGENGIEAASVSYTPGRFGNGIICNGSTKYVSFPNSGNIYLGTKGAIEFWFAPQGYSITDGSASTATPAFKFLFSTSGNTSANLFDFGFINNSGTVIRSRANGTYNGFGAGTLNPTGFTLADGVFGHVAIVWNETGIDNGSDTVRFYFNNVLLLSTTNSLTLPSSNTLWFGSYELASVYFANAIIDNLKIYDYAKTDFSDRFNERGGLNDQAIII
jgi:hypothetical protein